MLQFGFHSFLAYLIKRFLPKKEWLFFSFLIGTTISDVDIYLRNLFSALTKSEDIYFFLQDYNLFHSIFFILLIYLVILVFYEIYKHKNILNIAYGLTLGMIFHIIVDLLLSLAKINLLYPLPMHGISLWEYPTTSLKILIAIFMFFEFIFFRLFAYHLIEEILTYPKYSNNSLKPLTIWMQSIPYIYLFIGYFYIFRIDDIYIIYNILYIICSLSMFYMLFAFKDCINEAAVSIKKNKKLIYSNTKKTSIDNIG